MKKLLALLIGLADSGTTRSKQEINNEMKYGRCLNRGDNENLYFICQEEFVHYQHDSTLFGSYGKFHIIKMLRSL